MAAAAFGFPDRVLASLRSGVVGIDVSGALVLLNREAQRLLLGPEGAPEDWLGKDCREVLGAHPTVLRLLCDAAAGRGQLSRAELALDGGLTLGLSLFPVYDGEGAPRGAAMLFRDLAPVERSAEQERLQARLAALGQMAAGLAHEMRNPLASMEVLAGLLRRRLVAGSEERDLVDDLLAQLRGLSRIVTTSLDFVRPATPRRAPLHPVALVENALARGVPRGGAGVEIVRRFASPLPRIAVDEERMTIALANLFANACDAMRAQAASGRRIIVSIACEAPPPPEGCMRISEAPMAARGLCEGVRPAPDRAGPAGVTIAVADTGPGIPAELHEKIFYPFFTTREGGSGIGLATVQKIVSSHGGHVELESAPGAGTTFRVHLPIGSVAPGKT